MCAELAKVDVVATPACPNCRQRVADLKLDQLAAGAEHQCLFCGHFMKVPKPILEKLIAQRDAARASGGGSSVLGRVSAFFSRLFGRR